MNDKTKYTDLTGKLLLAMPGMQDPRFEKAVIFLCAHDTSGAMGLVINKVHTEIPLEAMLEELGLVSEITLPAEQVNNRISVMEGGPVETRRGFLLHSADFSAPETVIINRDYGVTGTMETLHKVLTGQGPEHVMFVLGYAGWQMGQLDQEIRDNAWLVTDSNPELLFNTTPDQKWHKALGTMGIDPALLSAQAGRA